jgi:hypothetical protein
MHQIRLLRIARQLLGRVIDLQRLRQRRRLLKITPSLLIDVSSIPETLASLLFDAWPFSSKLGVT